MRPVKVALLRNMSHAKLLKSVSRSFYLSMKFLPAAMREPVSLGYLLARTSDTLADTAAVSIEERSEALKKYRDAVCDEAELDGDFSIFRDALIHEGERRLLENASPILDWHRSQKRENRTLVSEVLKTITTGQQWDLDSKEVGDAETLLLYTYRVAGCVGEFWTHTGFENLGEKFADFENKSSMLESGKQLGQGLQLINILRDLHEDLANGRCYLPADELQSAGWDGGSPLRPDIVDPVFRKWLEQCRHFLRSGRTYIDKVKSRRIRFSTKLPLLLAEATADKLEAAGVEGVMTGKIKITRKEVRRAMWQSLRS